MKNLKKQKISAGRIFVVNMSEKIMDGQFNSNLLTVSKISDSMVCLNIKKVDGSILKIHDHIVTEKKFEAYCCAAKLKIVHRQTLLYNGEKDPIYILYILN